MKENNDIFLAGGDVLLYLDKPMQKKENPQCYFGAIHLVRTYLMTQLPSCTHLYIFLMTSPPFPQLLTYLIDGVFLNQKTSNNMRISY